MLDPMKHADFADLLYTGVLTSGNNGTDVAPPHLDNSSRTAPERTPSIAQGANTTSRFNILTDGNA
jgi:hypothetical protein